MDGRKLEGPKKSCCFFGWPKFFQNPSITLKRTRKHFIYRRWPKIKRTELGEGDRKLKGPKIKGAELREGGRKLEGPKIKGAEN